jgi:hypothetical protein
MVARLTSSAPGPGHEPGVRPAADRTSRDMDAPRAQGGAREQLRSSGGGARTHDKRINSPSLCQLSYPGKASPQDSSASIIPMSSRLVLVHA